MKSKIIFLKRSAMAFLLFISYQCSTDTILEEAPLKAVSLKANKLHFSASLKGRNEVPANTSKGAGQATVAISKEESSLDYKITAANLDDVFAAHFHIAEAGFNGPVVATLFLSPGNTGPQNGVLAEGTITAAEVTGLLAGDFGALVTAIREGRIYVNVHTSAVPTGELRGQLR